MRSGFSVVDGHCHIFPDKIAIKATQGTEMFYGITTSYGDGTSDMLLSSGGDNGIDRFVVTSVATKPAQVESINAFIATETATHPDRLVGLGALHPLSEDIECDVDTIISLGLHGVKLHPDIQKFAIDSAESREMFALCSDKLPILIHTGDVRFDFSNPNRMLPMLKAFPNVIVVGAHMGGWSIWEEATQVYQGIENFYVDCSSTFYAFRDNPEAIVKLIRAYGADRVIFGSDYPMWSPTAELEFFLGLPLTDTEREKILCKNAERVYSF